jgi:hypothetical protein
MLINGGQVPLRSLAHTSTRDRPVLLVNATPPGNKKPVWRRLGGLVLRDRR